jgi:hypothetical protein
MRLQMQLIVIQLKIPTPLLCTPYLVYVGQKVYCARTGGALRTNNSFYGVLDSGSGSLPPCLLFL